MHISDGVLPTGVTTAGIAVSAGLFLWSLKGIKEQEIPKSALVTTTVFVAALIHIPIGPTSVHLLLSGLAGILLGRGAFASISIAIFLQSLLFQFGGLTAIGANSLIMALPALLAGWLFRALIGRFGARAAALAGGLAAALSDSLSSLLLALFLWMSGEQFHEVAILAMTSQLPVIAVETLVTAFMAGFIIKVKPELFGEPILSALSRRVGQGAHEAEEAGGNARS